MVIYHCNNQIKVIFTFSDIFEDGKLVTIKQSAHQQNLK